MHSSDMRSNTNKRVVLELELDLLGVHELVDVVLLLLLLGVLGLVVLLLELVLVLITVLRGSCN